MSKAPHPTEESAREQREHFISFLKLALLLAVLLLAPLAAIIAYEQFWAYR